MSALTGVSSSGGVAYATQLAQTSALSRSLNSLGAAVQAGDLTSAGSILSALMKANPQYASSSTGGTAAQDPINQDFQTLSQAVANNQVDAARSAWTQLSSDLASSGISTTDNGASATAELLAQNKESLDQAILADFFGSSSTPSSALPLATDKGMPTTADWNSVLSNWITYNANGKASMTDAPRAPSGSVNATA